MNAKICHRQSPVAIRAHRAGLPGVDNHDAAVAEHFAGLVRANDYGSGFIDANAQELRLLEDRAEEAVRALTGYEVLIDYGVGQEAESIGRRDAACLDGSEALVLGSKAAFFAGDQARAPDGGTGAGPGDDAASSPHFV